MGNCIGKKSHTRNKYRRNSSSTVSTSKLRCTNQLNIKSSLPSSSKQTNNHIPHLSHTKDSNILLNNNERYENNVVEYPLSLTPTSIVAKDQFFLTHTSARLSPVQLSIQCETFKTNNDNVVDFDENNVVHPITLIQNEQDTTMGQLFNKENDTNNHNEVLIFAEEILSGSIGISSSPTLSDSSISSFSSNTTTSFSSQDRLILSSSYSSSETNPILSSSQLKNHNRFYFTQFHEQYYFDNQSSNEIFSTVFPVLSSRYKPNLLLTEFHKNTIIHSCQTFSTVIDDVIQQDFIRIHRRTKAILIEHKQLECMNSEHITKFHTPSLIFDENKKCIHLTKYNRLTELESIAYHTHDVSPILSSCDDCSLLLSGSKLNQFLHSFLLVNATYNLVQKCSNEINSNNIFGFISQKNLNRIQQTIVNNSKLNYSYDLDVDHTNFYVVLRVQSWPKEIRSIYEQRKRFWPSNIDNLFDNTCFVRFNGNNEELAINNTCKTCEKTILSFTNSSWTYTYSAIEAQLVHRMSTGHIRFASILWNYLNGRTQGQLPFVVFKHTLLYFFEQYSSDSFQTSDLFSHFHHFLHYLLHCFQTKSIPHYFNSNYNLYNEDSSMKLIDLISIKMTYSDLKNISIYHLPKSSLYLYHLIYLIQFQSNFFQNFRSSKTNLIQTILDAHELVLQHLSYGIKIYKQKLDSIISIKSYRSLTLDCLHQYQEDNVQTILDYLPLLRRKEPSLFIHSLWSIFIQYFNSLFDDLFIA